MQVEFLWWHVWLWVGRANAGAADDAPAKDCVVKYSSVGTWVRNDELSFNLPHPVAKETVVIRRRYDPRLHVDRRRRPRHTMSLPSRPNRRQVPRHDGDFAGLKVASQPDHDQWSNRRKIVSRTVHRIEICIRTTPKRLTCYATYTDSAGKQSLFREIFIRRSKAAGAT